MRRYRRIGFEERIKIFRLWLEEHETRHIAESLAPSLLIRKTRVRGSPRATQTLGKSEIPCQIAELIPA